MIELIVGLVSAIVLLFAKVKWDGRKIKDQERKIVAQEKKAEIIEDIHLATIISENKLKKALENIDTSEWRDGI